MSPERRWLGQEQPEIQVREQLRLGADTQGQPALEPQPGWTLLVQASWFENNPSLALGREEGHVRDSLAHVRAERRGTPR